MTDHPTDDERAALIAGDRADALEPGEAAELSLLADVLADPSTWAEPRAGLADDVVDAVAHAESGGSPTTRPLAAAAERQAASRRHRRLYSAAAAAAIVIVVVGALVAVRGTTRADYQGQLAATAAAPGAGGSVDIIRNDAGFRVDLDASGLPPLHDGEFYQAWLKNPAGTLVPIGSFSSSDGRVTLWSGVSPADFPTLTVTIEAPDNNQASSGRRVLVGDLTAP